MAVLTKGSVVISLHTHFAHVLTTKLHLTISRLSRGTPHVNCHQVQSGAGGVFD